MLPSFIIQKLARPSRVPRVVHLLWMGCLPAVLPALYFVLFRLYVDEKAINAFLPCVFTFLFAYSLENLVRESMVNETTISLRSLPKGWKEER